MSDGSDKKTKEQLLAELEELKRKLEQHDAAESSEPAHAQAADAKPDEPAADPSRRDALKKMWVAPVVLSLPMAQLAAGLGTILKPGTALAYYGGAGDDHSVINLPTLAPTRAPTAPPTAAPPTPAPTAPPTRAPTAPPTRAPTAHPTMAGHCVPAPTLAPTVSPVLGMASAPDCGSSSVGFIALGAARATARVRLRATTS